jgi:predicted esterase
MRRWYDSLWQSERVTWSRRDLLSLGVAAAPLLAWRCAPSARVGPDSSEGRLHARPEGEENARALPAMSQPQPLDLGSPRDGAFYVPATKRADVAAPLLLYLHGAGGSGGRALAPWIEHADRTGAIIVAPDSRDATWGVVGGNDEEDLAFLDDVLEKIFSSYAVDPRRLAIGGFSDGASAALSIGLVNGDLFPGIAAFSPGFVSLSGGPQGSPRIFISHGLRDSVLPVEQCGRRISGALAKAGYRVRYDEFDGDHTVPPQMRSSALDWLFRSV